MSLARFNIIVAVDSAGGISREGELPWNNQADMRFFRETTVGRGRNAVIMGRKTYESIPAEVRPLAKRSCHIISSTWSQESHPDIRVHPSLMDGLIYIGSSRKKYNDVFVIGGETIYHQVMDRFLYLCDKIYLTKFKINFNCDKFFPVDPESMNNRFTDSEFQTSSKTRDYTRFYYSPNLHHQEYKYLNLLKDILQHGEQSSDVTGASTQYLLGKQLRFNITEKLPILTTNKINYTNLISELLFFISGKTDTKPLEKEGITQWKNYTSRKFLDDKALEWKEGDMGPHVGFQWRHWNAAYTGCLGEYKDQGIDQLENVIRDIVDDPYSRRHFVSSWNVEQLDKIVSPPTQYGYQFKVSGDRRYLDCLVILRSGDMFLEVPRHITQYAILMYIVAQLCNLKPRELILNINDAYIYNNHVTKVEKLVNRTPRPWPVLKFKNADNILNIDKIKQDDIIVDGYSSWALINAPVAFRSSTKN